jgi:peptide/nickel transport system substrate-binding protein
MKKFVAFMLALAMMLSLAACGGSSSSDSSTDADAATSESAEANAGDSTDGSAESADPDRAATTEVTIGSTGANFVGHFDPDGVFSTECGYVMSYLCYDPILYTDPETGEWVSDILADYHWDEEDETKLVMTLRDDVYFSNGDQMTAEDLWYTLARCADLMVYSTLYAYVDMDNTYVDPDNDLVLYMQFTDTFGPYETLLRNGVVNESWIEENGGEENFDWFDPSLVCGSGPYAVTEFTNGISTTFELRDDWWYKDEADADYCSVQTINIKQYSDSNTLMVDYETGTIDAAVNLSASDVDSINDAAGSKGTAVTIPSNYTAAIVLGVDNNSIFDNMNLRKAICLGTDADAIATAVYGSLGDPATSTLPTSSPYYKEGYAYTYDLEAAQAALADYYAETGENSVNLTFVAASGGVDAEIAELFQAYMEAVGITVDLQILDQGTAVGMWIDGATDFMINNSANGNSTNEVTNVYEHYESTDVFKADARQGEEINSLLTAGRLTVDTTERASIYEQVQQYFYDNYEVIPVAEWNVAYAYNDTISELSLLDVSRPNLRFMAG